MRDKIQIQDEMDYYMDKRYAELLIYDLASWSDINEMNHAIRNGDYDRFSSIVKYVRSCIPFNPHITGYERQIRATR